MNRSEAVDRVIAEWKLSAVDSHNRDTWRSVERSTMCAASKLPGRGSTDVDVPLYFHVNQKSGDDDDGLQFLHSAIPLSALNLGIKFQYMTFNTFRDVLQTKVTDGWTEAVTIRSPFRQHKNLMVLFNNLSFSVSIPIK